MKGFFDRRAESSIRSAFEEAVGALASQGAEVLDLDDPIDFEQVIKDHRKVMAAEAAAVHSDWLDEFSGDYPERIRDLILEGRSLSALEYLCAKHRMVPAMWSVTESLHRGKLDALITPATIGTPPDRSTTGDPAFNSPWSFSRLPTVSFPIGLAADGAPVALQLIGADYYDLDLLREAAWCEQVIRT